MKVKILNIIDDKTVNAVSTSYKKHPRYGKYVTVSKKYIADSCGKKLEIGQQVEIVPSRPVSKLKNWRVEL